MYTHVITQLQRCLERQGNTTQLAQNDHFEENWRPRVVFELTINTCFLSCVLTNSGLAGLSSDLIGWRWWVEELGAVEDEFTEDRISVALLSHPF